MTNDTHDHGDEGYTGPATLVLEGTELEVHVELRGHFQPIDGFYHWYGRLRADDRVSDLAAGRKRRAELRTPTGSAAGEIADPDPWDRYRISGTSTPPFAVPTPPELLA